MSDDLIKRSDVIKFLNNYLDDCYRVSRRNYEKTMLDAISMDFEAVITNIPAVEPKTKVVAQVTFDEDKLREIVTDAVSEWIPCSEGLPNKYKSVLTTSKNGRVRENFINACGWSYDTYAVVAWMPLPPAYKGVNKCSSK